jgi:hypothetical protein
MSLTVGDTTEPQRDNLRTQLKAKLDALCADIATRLDSSETAGEARAAADQVSYRSTKRSADWWPAGLGMPGAVGAQNNFRYAVFPEARRLVIDDQGTITSTTRDLTGFSASPRPEQRPNPDVHKPGRIGQDRRSAEGCPLAGAAAPCPRAENSIVKGNPRARPLSAVHGACGGV